MRTHRVLPQNLCSFLSPVSPDSINSPSGLLEPVDICFPLHWDRLLCLPSFRENSPNISLTQRWRSPTGVGGRPCTRRGPGCVPALSLRLGILQSAAMSQTLVRSCRERSVAKTQSGRIPKGQSWWPRDSHTGELNPRLPRWPSETLRNVLSASLLSFH